MDDVATPRMRIGGAEAGIGRRDDDACGAKNGIGATRDDVVARVMDMFAAYMEGDEPEEDVVRGEAGVVAAAHVIVAHATGFVRRDMGVEGAKMRVGAAEVDVVAGEARVERSVVFAVRPAKGVGGGAMVVNSRAELVEREAMRVVTVAAGLESPEAAVADAVVGVVRRSTRVGVAGPVCPFLGH